MTSVRASHPLSVRRTAGAVAIGTAVLAGAFTAAPAAAVDPITIDAGPDVSVFEGSPVVRTVPIVDAVDDGEPGWSYSIDYGDGLVTVGTTLSPSLTLDHAYPDGPAIHTAAVTVTDVPGDVAGDSFVVTVNNVAPVIGIVAVPTVTEGSTYTITVSGTDPAGANDPLSMILDWGDGTFSTQSFRPLGTVTHVFRDDQDGTVNATVRNVNVTLFDGTAISSVVVPVTVTDVAPTIALSGAATASAGTPFQLTLGAVTDPGVDTVTSRIVNWGDGVSETVLAGGIVNHTYATSGTKNIVVDLVNEDGLHLGAGRATVTVGVVAPTAPTGLTAVATSRSAIRLTWTNTAAAQTSVQIERCKGTGCTSFSRVATVSGSATTFLNTGLSSRTSYTYRVRVVNSVGASPWSTVAGATTPRN